MEIFFRNNISINNHLLAIDIENSSNKKCERCWHYFDVDSQTGDTLNCQRCQDHLHGALKNWVDLQDDFECFFFIADWHALSSLYEDPRLIKNFSYEVAVDWLSAGLDPEKCTLFLQSKIPEHAELHLILSI